ncbi:hypothetical protein V3851_05340 [Paenibacillus sp. M1]|uniref:Uncharacterized protein n=1 Tax=Paenibacillus haidiansis TaxID=1574488 RepID=A0ABU7VP48_9BACL
MEQQPEQQEKQQQSQHDSMQWEEERLLTVDDILEFYARRQ